MQNALQQFFKYYHALFLRYCWSTIAKRHFPKNRLQMSDVFRDVTEGPV